MKVIKNGKEKVYDVTCNLCDSDLEYTSNDVFTITEEARGGIEQTISRPFKDDERYINFVLHKYNCVRCPVCNNIIKIGLDINSLFKDDGERWIRIS